jgi:hypothetical protein
MMPKKLLDALYGVHMQDGGDPTQMFNFNPMAAKAAKQKQMRESTPETPLGALSRGFATGLFGSTEEQVPYTGSIMEGSPQRQQSQANLREIGRNIGALTDIYGMVTPFAAASAASKANQVPGLAELIAYHGSPHKFKKFDASKIGTGEGAQAYGHGLYFAENPKVAKSYAETLGDAPIPRIQIDSTLSNKAHTFVENALKYNNYDNAKAIEKLYKNKQLMQSPESIAAATEAINALKHGRVKVIDPENFDRGVFYTVDIPDEKIAQMLDWDKPLSQQPKAVQEAVNSIVLAEELYKGKYAPRFLDTKTTGGEAIEIFNSVLGSPQVTSNYLREAGIPGIQYLDQASRDAKQGTRNFVVFPGEEQNIKMLDINGEPQMAKGGKVRISDNPDTMLLELMSAPKMQAGGAALKAFRDKLLAQYQRSLAKDPRFKQAPGEVTNLAGKSYAQWAAEQQYKHELEDALAKLSGVPEKKMSIQDLPVGSRLVSIIGDRTQADKILRSVNETPLANEVILYGGPRFGQGKLAQGKEDFWASQGQAAQGVQNRIDAAAERAKGKPVIGVYTAMSAKDSDMYAKHFAESLIEQYPFMGMTGKQVDAFNKEFRKKYPQFAGVDNPEFVDQIMANTEMRKAFVNEHLKKKNIEKFNIPDGLATRHAITVPELRDVPTGLAGYSVGEMKPGMALEKGSYLEHPTYNTVIPGRYMGGLEIMHDYRDLFPEATQRMRQTLRNNPKFQGPGARDPESQMFGTFGFQGAEQEVTQKLIDELAAREELIKQLGILPYKKGGKVKKVKINNNPDAMQLELMRKKKHA